MKVLKTIKDEDIGSTIPMPKTFKERKASRAIIFDADKKVALIDATKKGYHKLPGGKIEEGENINEALHREVLEETGYSITDIQELGIIEEYRNDSSLHQISYCFTTALLLGEKNTQKLQPNEEEDGFEPVWMVLDEAIKTLEIEKNSVTHYDGRFICLRDLALLKEAKRVLLNLK